MDYQKKIAEQRAEIERLSTELERTKRDADRLRALPISKDLHRGVDPERPPRPDTITLRRTAKHQTPAVQHALEAVVAGVLSKRESGE